MIIELDNLDARLVDPSASERAFVSEYLTFPAARAFGRKPQPIRMFNAFADKFPAGFASIVAKAAQSEGIRTTIADARGMPPVQTEPANSAAGWLRDYQRAALDRSLARVRGILWMPTGSGKTEVAIALANCVPARWLFLVHRRTLLEQAAERYERRTGEGAGRVGDGQWSVGRRFTVASFQSIAGASGNRVPLAAKLLHETEGLIVDECHVLPAESWWRVAMATPRAYWRIGVSGTPLARGDRRSILAVAALGPVIYRLTPEALIDRGLLARPIIRMVRVEQTTDRSTWQGVYSKCVVRSSKRNDVLARLAVRAAKPCLVFIKQIAHGRALAKKLARVGVRTEFVWGRAPEPVRRDLVRALEGGRLDALICSVIFQEGIDLPSLRSIIVASGGKSAIAALQRIGRGMRRDAGKRTFEVYDIADRGHAWLERHTRTRVRAYESEGFAVEEEDFEPVPKTRVRGASLNQ